MAGNILSLIRPFLTAHVATLETEAGKEKKKEKTLEKMVLRSPVSPEDMLILKRVLFP